MKKRLISMMLCTAMTAGLLVGSGTLVHAEEEYDLTLYSNETTREGFDPWLEAVEAATGLNINVIAAPTDSDTRQQKITTILSTGDSSIDVLCINDEMATAFKNTGWLEPVGDTVMTEDIIGQFAEGYIAQMLTNKDGEILGVPGYRGDLAMWVNTDYMKEAGLESIDTKEDFVKYLETVSKDGKYGYGGSWEKTYSHNELGQFVNMFGGDYLDWTNPANKEAMEFMKEMVQNGWTSEAQLADKYEQMEPLGIDGTYGSWFMWGIGESYPENIQMVMVPDLGDVGTKYIFADSWNFVINAASENKEAATKFLQFMASEEGGKLRFEYLDRYPARADVAEEVVPDDHPAKLMYSRYAEECHVAGRPMLPQSMEFLTEMGTLFQRYIKDEITVDELCVKAQEAVEKYSE